MKTALFLALLIAGGIEAVPAQSLRYSPAQPYTALSAYSLQQLDPLSFTGNQAALANAARAGFGIYGERRFMLSETGLYLLGATLPTRFGNFGLQVNYAGFKNFNENKIGLAYARKLGKLADIGVQFNYYGYRIPAYGNASTVNFEIGCLLHLAEKLNAGLHVYNPVGGKLGGSAPLSTSAPLNTSAPPNTSAPLSTKAEKIAAAYKLGLGYDASDHFFISSEIIREEDKPVNVIAGLQYQFARQFFVKAGVISESASVYAGAGVAWKNLRLDIASGYHPRLGFSPGILLIMDVKAKTE